MLMPLLLTAATLVVVLALFWGRFRSLGFARVTRLMLIWAVVILALLVAVRTLNLESYLS